MKDIPIIEISPSDTRIVQDKDGNDMEVSILIPQCCREGWASCKHTVKQHKPTKRNIGL